MQQLQLQPRRPPPPPVPAAVANIVYKGDVMLDNVTDIAKFVPRLRGVTKIEGNVDIGFNLVGGHPGSPITEAQLAGMFSAVREITGRLGIAKRQPGQRRGPAQSEVHPRNRPCWRLYFSPGQPETCVRTPVPRAAVQKGER